MPKPYAPREIKNPRVDKTMPAYLVVMKWGSLARFCRSTGYKASTVYDWLIKGLIPSDNQAKIRADAEQDGIELEPALFVPAAEAA